MKISPKTMMTNNGDAACFAASVHIESGLDERQAGSFYEIAPDALSFSCRKAEHGGLDLLWTFDYPPDTGALRDALAALCDGAIGAFSVEAIDADRNWLEESYRALPPFTVGPFFVHGSHFEGNVPEGALPLLIDAATAFGSGEHGTTATCLLALDDLRRRGFTPARVLDMGCGSGILAIGAARLWPGAPVIAADNDPECVDVTARHVALNVTPTVTPLPSEGYEPASPVWGSAPYDLIIANILAAPLIEMAAEQSRALAPGGWLILSGTLTEQADRVIAAYVAHGLIHERNFTGGEWTTMVMRRPAGQAG